MACEFLEGDLVDGLFTEVGGQEAVGLKDGIQRGLHKVAQSGNAAPGRLMCTNSQH